jgi:S-adenosylmethionine hydrolase
MPILTITTDFGTKDGFAPTMKGVIWSINPEIQIADITHEVSPQNVLEGAIALWRAAPFFPAGTVHVAVVDPGVGTHRRPMAARIGGHYFVGPDNGLFTPFIEDARAKGEACTFIDLDKPQYWLANVSHTFHGRDIFAPAGGHLANGVRLEDMGTLFDDPVLLVLPKPEKTARGFHAHITVVDTFGNLTTDLPGAALNGRPVRVSLKGHTIEALSPSYGHQPVGTLVTLIDSEGFLEVAVVNGSGAKTLGAAVGDVVEVVFSD